MAEYFERPFAENGLKQNISIDSTIDGTISWESGWTDQYESDPLTDDNAKFVELRDMNQLWFKATSNIKEWQEQTFPEWIADAGSGTPFAYSENAIVHYLDGETYISLVDNNTQVPTGSNWKKFGTSFVDTYSNQTIGGTKTFSSVINGSINGNSTTATKLQTARNINGVSFDGASNITVYDSTKVPTNGVQSLNATDALRISGTTLSLHKGNGTSESVSLPNNSIGVGQNYYNVTSSRSDGVTYTNNTGKPITVIIHNSTAGSGITQIGGTDITGSPIGGLNVATYIVPNGMTYKTTGSNSFYRWVELR